MTAYPLGFEIACDGPSAARECPDSAAVPRRFASRTKTEVRADGRELGWMMRRRGGRVVDLCPNCREVA